MCAVKIKDGKIEQGKGQIDHNKKELIDWLLLNKFLGPKHTLILSSYSEHLYQHNNLFRCGARVKACCSFNYAANEPTYQTSHLLSKSSQRLGIR